MALMNHIRLTVAGTDYTIATDEPEEYVRRLADKVDRQMRALLEGDTRVTLTMASVLTAITLADEAEKSAESLDNLRSQIQGYLEDSHQARTEADSLRREMDRLRRENEFLRAKQDHSVGETHGA